MEFNSWQFILFFASLMVLYWLTPTRRLKNILLLVASYIFYSAWDWRFAGLILLSTITDYSVGKRLHLANTPAHRRSWLVISLVVNLGVLGFFKYFNFFIGSLLAALHSIGLDAEPARLNIILPIGISFYTFQTLSYTIDIYRRQLEPSSSFEDFALFVAFFPQLIAGPIERARNILPQLQLRHTITTRHLGTGLQLILWGLFKKVYVADNIALIVDRLFDRSAELPFGLAYLAVLGFAVQIYADFSAYTDIARGCAKIFGIDLMENFRNPYTACNPQDFWRRWHISLSTWLRDYLYIPLGGNRCSKLLSYRNLMLTMILGGLWHGAAWNFVWWGIYHGVLLAVYRGITSVSRITVPRALSVPIMFHLTLFGWMLFRCTRTILVDGFPQDQSFSQIGEFLSACSRGVGLDGIFSETALRLVLFSLPLFAFELLNAKNRSLYPLYFGSRGRSIMVNALILFLIVRYGVQNAESFIYFQF